MDRKYQKSALQIKKRKMALSVLALFVFLFSGFNLEMSFSSQAPEGNWNEPWYNDCEEVSIVMVDSFYNKRILTKAIAKKEILRIIGLKEKAYGSSLDENADEIVNIINNFLNWNARIAEASTIDEIKKEIDAGHPVIMPTDGRKLNNRYYTTSEYHVFVISGYDDAKKMFITQDAGTYRGHDYQYSYAVVMNAMHDYDSADLAKGRKVAIFTSPEIKETDKPEIKITPSPTAVPRVVPFKAEEIKKNIPIVISSGKIEDGGLMKTIGDWWSRLVIWIKSIF